MRLRFSQQDGILDCCLSGGFTLSDHFGIGVLSERLSQPDVQELRVDLSEVCSINSAGLAMLAGAQAAACRLGKRLSLNGADATLSRILELAGAVAVDGAIPTLASGAADEAAIAAALQPPGHGFAEAGLQPGPHGLRALQAGGLCLCLRTETAARLDLPGLLCEAVAVHFPQHPPALDGMRRMALAEAVNNAVIHGNLALSSALRGSCKGLVTFSELADQRLAEPHYGQRMVEVALCPCGPERLAVMVSDQGEGYDFAHEHEHPDDPNEASGRGLALIRKASHSVWNQDGGRTLVMVV